MHIAAASTIAIPYPCQRIIPYAPYLLHFKSECISARLRYAHMRHPASIDHTRFLLYLVGGDSASTARRTASGAPIPGQFSVRAHARQSHTNCRSIFILVCPTRKRGRLHYESHYLRHPADAFQTSAGLAGSSRHTLCSKALHRVAQKDSSKPRHSA